MQIAYIYKRNNNHKKRTVKTMKTLKRSRRISYDKAIQVLDFITKAEGINVKYLGCGGGSPGTSGYYNVAENRIYIREKTIRVSTLIALIAFAKMHQESLDSDSWDKINLELGERYTHA